MSASACASSPVTDEVPDFLDASSQIDPAVGSEDDNAPRPTLDAQVDAATLAPERRDASSPGSSRDDEDASLVEVEASVEPTEGPPVDAGATTNSPIDAGSEVVLVPPDSGPSEPTCATGKSLCAGACVDLQTSANHCGTCGTSCGAATCAAAVCTAPAPAGCTAKTHGGHSYLFCTTQLDWIDARDNCVRAKLDMTVINDAAENEFVRAAGPTWVGASDIDGETRWRALAPGVQPRASGPLVSYTNWAPGEPSNTFWCAGIRAIGDDCLFATTPKSDEDCGLMRADGRWDDVLCSQQSSYVCESY